jgi:ankyrin repeat protein
LMMEDQLVDKNIETKEGMNVLHLAAGTGQKDVVKMLLEKGIGIEPDNFRRTPLMLAIRNNHNDIFFSLFQASTKYYRRDFSHNTLLHYAAAYGNV